MKARREQEVKDQERREQEVKDQERREQASDMRTWGVDSKQESRKKRRVKQNENKQTNNKTEKCDNRTKTSKDSTPNKRIAPSSTLTLVLTTQHYDRSFVNENVPSYPARSKLVAVSRQRPASAPPTM